MLFDHICISVDTDLLLEFLQQHPSPLSGGFLESSIGGFNIEEFEQFVADKSEQEIASSPSKSKPVSKVRDAFPETWIWSNCTTG